MQLNFEAIGSHWQIDIDVDKRDQLDLQQDLMTLVESFDQTYSRFRNDSLVHQIASRSGRYSFPANAKQLFHLYRQLYDLSRGSFTPLVGDLLVDTGYDAQYSLVAADQIRPTVGWESVMEYSHPVLETKQPVTLDFGAAGKGYLIDLIGRLVRVRGVKNFTIDGSGDIKFAAENRDSLRVGLEHPEQTGQVIGVLKLDPGQAIASSSGNRRRWEGYHHIIDPKLQKSPEHILATWVMADEAMTADALSTALFLVESETLQKKFEFEYLILYPDMKVNRSAGFQAELCTQQSH